MRARIRDTELYFDVDGVGLVIEGVRAIERPTAFLIHGGPGGDHTASKSRYEPLTQRMQLVYFDQRGQGRSARDAPQRYTLNENVEDLEALRSYLGLPKIVVIGTSYGGMVAMAHAARYPNSVSRLILVATSAHSGYVAKSLEFIEREGSPEQVDQCEDLFAGRLNTAEKIRHYYEIMGPLYSRSGDLSAMRAALERTIWSPEALNRAHGPNGFLRSFDLRPELTHIKSPTLILVGRHDWISPPEFSIEIQQLIHGSDLRIFEDSGHFIALDEPENFLDAIKSFVN